MENTDMYDRKTQNNKVPFCNITDTKEMLNVENEPLKPVRLEIHPGCH